MNFLVGVLESHNEFYLGRLLCYVIFGCFSFRSPLVNGWLYCSELLNLKLSFYFSALVLKVRNCGLELLREDFAEKVPASMSTMSFLVVASVLLFVRCVRAVGCQLFFLTSFTFFRVFSLRCLKVFRLMVVGSL